jgi:hypothetical protein
MQIVIKRINQSNHVIVVVKKSPHEKCQKRYPAETTDSIVVTPFVPEKKRKG